MPTAINALSGVQWTHIDGTATSAAERSAVTTNVNEITTFMGRIELMLDRATITQGATRVSWNELVSPGDARIVDNYEGGAFTVHARAAYATCIGEDAVRARLASLPNASAVSYLDDDGQVRFATKNGIGQIEILPQRDANGAEINRWTLRQWGYAGSSIHVSYSNPITAAISLARLNELTGLNINATDSLSRNQWQTVLEKLKTVSYQESSRLSTADGGGLKTYNGKWYANGQELSYLDITFAVRVNQLFVINNTVTDYLSQLQKNNVKIKNANAVAAVISSLAPTGASGTVNINDIKNRLLDVALSAGLIPDVQHFTSLENAKAYLATGNIANGTKVLFKATDGNYTWLVKGGTGVTPTYTQSPIGNYNLNWSKVAELFPQSITKLLTLDTSGLGTFKTGTLTQNDCTTIVTELKSYTTSVESSSQVAQTQLDQYNNKRTEVLDNISNVIKGNNTTLNSVSKNLGAL